MIRRIAIALTAAAIALPGVASAQQGPRQEEPGNWRQRQVQPSLQGTPSGEAPQGWSPGPQQEAPQGWRPGQPQETQQGQRENRNRQRPEPRGQQPAMPSADRILRQLEDEPRMRVPAQRRVTVQEFKRRPDLRRAAPSIEIQSINFGFGSADIPYSQFDKVEEIADALSRMLRRNPGARVLVEGHTDAVGSAHSNQVLSERRAESLKRILVREFGISSRAIETVGYGEEYLLVDTPYESWENRRVTLRRVDQFLR